MARRKSKSADKTSPESTPTVTVVDPPPVLIWLKAAYHFHSFAYRDPRSAFSSAMGLPVVSPTTVLLGIVSALFTLGADDKAKAFLKDAHRTSVVVDSSEGMIFFRAFHQIRRYETDKYGINPRMGLTDINQGTREYGLPEGNLTVYVGAPEQHEESVRLALRNRDHLGTHDSLCSLVDDVEICEEPKDVVYRPIGRPFAHPSDGHVTVVTLSRFKSDRGVGPTVGKHWWMAGGENTELVPYLIKGRFRGTSRGKIYTKD